MIEESKALETKQKKKLELIRLLESKNVRYEDKRYKKEGFYLIGGGDLSRVILEADRLGYKFQLDKNKNRWYLQGFRIASKKRKDEIPKRRDAIIILLDGTDIEYVDKRNDYNGALWIIGGNELKNFVEFAKGLGIHFRYQPEGSRFSDYKPAWWAK